VRSTRTSPILLTGLAVCGTCGGGMTLRTRAALTRLKTSARDGIRLTPDLIERFSATLREHVTSRDVQFRKAYLGATIDRIEVDDR